MFYPKLAWNNLVKNRKSYIPYALSCIFAIITFFSLNSVYKSDSFKNIPHAESLYLILKLGSWVIAIFSTIFIFYTNNFLIKQRKKELGLYSILGLEKKHMAKVLFLETVYMAVISITAGTLFGFLMGKLSFLGLQRLLKIDRVYEFTLSGKAIGTTILLYCSIYAIVLVSNLFRVHMTKPIELLKGGQHGEKEPKASWLLALVGVITLGAAYYISITIQNPIETIMMFFVAVILVIIGTFCIFTAGSIVILKLLKKNKSYYYRPKNFISVSTMIYRMKQNAAGLSNICILSTMVLVMLTGSVALYVGQKDVLYEQFPYHVMITTKQSDKNEDIINSLIKEQAEKDKVFIEDQVSCKYTMVLALNKEKNTFVCDFDVSANMALKYCNLFFIDQESYNKFAKEQIDLTEKQVLLFRKKKEKNYNTILLGNQEFSVAYNMDSMLRSKRKNTAFDDYCYIVMKDEQVITQVVKSMTEGLSGETLEEFCGEKTFFFFDVKAEEEKRIQYTQSLMEKLDQESFLLDFNSYYLSFRDWYYTFGGLLFLGVFLGLLFLMMAILIIYYKQISEGYEDHDRFLIMQKVGMSRSEVKSTITKQVLMVFFLPLVFAVIHLAFAMPVLIRILALFSLYNTTLILLCAAVIALVFAVLYCISYMATAKAYFKLV
ncbi:FtsX-like permease family protein [Anaeromicropila populeti]|uniref:Putative ABC transport system permease protein n=1 Tax=Anaeromicropila populeti TaxID=37658 RepID=A0A1I6J209_9FIRM|nr:ABC transporter permease [Anaeromicropila populeti]SFR73032.1 putative ABC transport system permease protein [Anaeromicropila populeti]